MKKEDLQIGYLVKYRNGSLRMVMPTQKRLIFIGEDGGHMYIDDYDDELFCKQGRDYDIIEVYSFSEFNTYALKVETYNRELLWQRENKKEMTISEIEKELGYSIKIVKED